MDTKEVWETPRTLLGTLKIVFHWCQRQLQISHAQPEVFIQEPRNFGFDKKPQVGVNISLATFYDIYTLYGSSWSDDCGSVLQASVAESSPPQPSGGETASGQGE